MGTTSMAELSGYDDVSIGATRLGAEATDDFAWPRCSRGRLVALARWLDFDRACASVFIA